MGLTDNLKHYFYSDDDVFALGVGLKFPLSRKAVGDGCKMEIVGNSVFICLYFSNPTQEEIDLVNKGNITLFFSYLQPVLECCVEINGNIYGDMPFYAPIYGEANDEDQEFLYLCLVDAETDVLQAIRDIRITQVTSSYLGLAQSDQFKNFIPFEWYDYLVAEIKQNVSIGEIISLSSYRIDVDSKNKVSETLNPNPIEFSFIKK